MIYYWAAIVGNLNKFIFVEKNYKRKVMIFQRSLSIYF